MSDVLEKIKTRRSVKKYKPDMIPQDIIDKVTEAGLYAANGMGRQATIIIQVTNKEMRDKLSELNRQIGGWKEGFDPFYGAPAVLVVLGKKDCPTHVYDGSLVMGNLMLGLFVFCSYRLFLTNSELEAAGFTALKKNLKQISEKNC